MNTNYVEGLFALVLALGLAYVCYHVAYDTVITLHAYNLAASIPASL